MPASQCELGLCLQHLYWHDRPNMDAAVPELKPASEGGSFAAVTLHCSSGPSNGALLLQIKLLLQLRSRQGITASVVVAALHTLDAPPADGSCMQTNMQGSQE